MAEANQYVFSHKQLAEILVREQGIHEGLWIIQYTFGIGGANVGPTPQDIAPAAIVPIVSVSLARAQEASALTVDAAVANPIKQENLPSPPGPKAPKQRGK